MELLKITNAYLHKINKTKQLSIFICNDRYFIRYFFIHHILFSKEIHLWTHVCLGEQPSLIGKDAIPYFVTEVTENEIVELLL